MQYKLFLLTLLTLGATAAVAAMPSETGQPVYAVLEYKEVTISGINEKSKSVNLKLPNGGGHLLNVGPKTWIIKDGNEGKFEDLRVGQLLHVRYIPRNSQAVTLEVLPPKSEK